MLTIRHSTEKEHDTWLGLGEHASTLGNGSLSESIQPPSRVNNSRETRLGVGKALAEVTRLRDGGVDTKSCES